MPLPTVRDKPIRAIIFAAVSLMLTAPVLAQGSTPTPNGTVSELRTLINDLGVQWFILVAIIILVLLGVARGMAPLFKALGEANKSRDELQERLLERLEKSDRERERMNTQGDSNIVALNGIVASLESFQHENVDGRNKAVTTLAQTIQREHGATREAIDGVISEEHAKTRQQITDAIASIEQAITQVISAQQQLTERIDANDTRVGGEFERVFQNLENLKRELSNRYTTEAATPETKPEAENKESS